MKKGIVAVAVIIVTGIFMASYMPNTPTDNVVFDGFDSDSTLTAWYETRPVAGVPVNGATGLLITMTADSIGTGASRADKGDFSISVLFSKSASDTAIYMYPASDTILVTSSAVYGFAKADGSMPSITYAVDCPGTQFTGYAYVRVKGQGLTILGNFDMTLTEQN